MKPYSWPLVDEFLDRARELERLDAWWDGPDRRPVAMAGRRRVGKSWLFRRFAHGKPAVLLVAEQLPPVESARVVYEPVMGSSR